MMDPFEKQFPMINKISSWHPNDVVMELVPHGADRSAAIRLMNMGKLQKHQAYIYGQTRGKLAGLLEETLASATSKKALTSLASKL